MFCDVVIRQQYLENKKAERQARKEQAKQKGKGDQASEAKVAEEPFKPNMVVSIKNIGAGVSRENIRAVFEEFGKVAYIDFAREQVDGFVRFDEEGAAEKAAKALQEKKPTLGDQENEVTLLTGDEEKAYWTKLNEDRAQRTSSKKHGRTGGGRGGRGAKARRTR